MEQTSKKNNILLALLLSMLTALGGGVLFGIIYGIGYYIYLLALGEIILACNIFFKFYAKVNWKTITLAIVWSVVWTFIFNFFAIIVCEAIWVANEANCSFSDAYKIVIELWKTNAEIKAYMNKRMLQVAGMILLGGIVYGAYFIANIVKAKKNNQSASNNETQTNNQTQITNIQKPENMVKPEQQNAEINETKKDFPTLSKAEETYNLLIVECKNAILKFVKDKNQEAFKTTLKELKLQKISSLSAKEKEEIATMANNMLKVENISEINKKSNETLIKLL